MGDVEWELAKRNWRDFLFARRWALAYRLLIWSVCLMPDTLTGRVFMRHILAGHREAFPGLYAEAKSIKYWFDKRAGQ